MFSRLQTVWDNFKQKPSNNKKEDLVPAAAEVCLHLGPLGIAVCCSPALTSVLDFCGEFSSFVTDNADSVAARLAASDTTTTATTTITDEKQVAAASVLGYLLASSATHKKASDAIQKTDGGSSLRLLSAAKQFKELFCELLKDSCSSSSPSDNNNKSNNEKNAAAEASSSSSISSSLVRALMLSPPSSPVVAFLKSFTAPRKLVALGKLFHVQFAGFPMKQASPDSQLELLAMLETVSSTILSPGVFSSSSNSNSNSNSTTPPTSLLPLSKSILLLACLSTFPSAAASGGDNDVNSSSVPAHVPVALVRHASSIIETAQQHQQPSSATASLAQCFPLVITLIVDVLQLQKNNSAVDGNNANSSSSSSSVLFGCCSFTDFDNFLRDFAAPLLSQFGFEFLWKNFSSIVQQGSSNEDVAAASGFSSPAKRVVDLLHFCQELTYAERLQVLVVTNTLTTRLLPDSVGAPTAPLSSSSSSETAAASQPPKQHQQQQQQIDSWIPKWWQKCFGEVDAALSSSSSTSSQSAAAGGEAAAAVASSLRRYRAKVKVALSERRAGDDTTNQDHHHNGWLELYAAAIFISSGGDDSAFKMVDAKTKSAIKNLSRKLPREVASKLYQVVVGTSSSTSMSAAADSVDPLMLACFYFCAPASSSCASGRSELLSRLSSQLAASSVFSTQSQWQQHVGPFWLIAALMTLSGVVLHHSLEEESPLKVALFESAMVMEMLKKIRALCWAGHVSVVRFDALVCGFVSSASGAEEDDDGNNDSTSANGSSSSLSSSSSVDDGSAIFRRAFFRSGVVRKNFADTLRAAWSRTLEEERKSSSLSSTTQQQQAQNFVVDEILSLLTTVVSRLAQWIHKIASAAKKDSDDALSSASSSSYELEQERADVLGLCGVVVAIANEWKCADVEFSKLVVANNKSASSDDVECVLELIDRSVDIVTKRKKFVGSDFGDALLEQLNECRGLLRR